MKMKSKMMRKEDDDREPQDIHSIDAEDAQAAVASAAPKGTCANNRSDEDSLSSLDSEMPSVELRAGDKIQYYQFAHVGNEQQK